jgi:cyanophycin synthetase
MAREGDLLVIFGDEIRRCWKQVANYEVGESGRGKASEESAVQTIVEEDPEAFVIDPETEIIRDDRGVRIARVDEESD